MEQPQGRRARFRSWVADHGGETSHDHHDCERPEATWSVGELLYELWDDLEELPTAERMGLPRGSTYAHAARLIWVLRDDDVFPASTHAEVVGLLQGHPNGHVAAAWRDIDEALRSREPL